ncbi:hypothetical protein B4168_3059 [Anoxybacillus flavithermus]|nr:hypothetical protein B4168_3059 [Anoxybacillus flavithermus]
MCRQLRKFNYNPFYSKRHYDHRGSGRKKALGNMAEDDDCIN